MKKTYIVRLTEEERDSLNKLVNTGRQAAYTRRNAQILLLSDQSEHGPSYTDSEIAKTVGVSSVTVENVRNRLVLKGMDCVLTRAKRCRERSQVLDGDAKAKLITIAYSTASDGRKRWTLRMLADEMVKRKIVRTVSHEAVRQTLKKMK